MPRDVGQKGLRASAAWGKHGGLLGLRKLGLGARIGLPEASSSHTQVHTLLPFHPLTHPELPQYP